MNQYILLQKLLTLLHQAWGIFIFHFSNDLMFNTINGHIQLLQQYSPMAHWNIQCGTIIDNIIVPSLIIMFFTLDDKMFAWIFHRQVKSLKCFDG